MYLKSLLELRNSCTDLYLLTYVVLVLCTVSNFTPNCSRVSDPPGSIQGIPATPAPSRKVFRPTSMAHLTSISLGLTRMFR